MAAQRLEAELIEKAEKKGGGDPEDPAAVRERLRKKIEEKKRGNSSRADRQG